MTGLDTTTTGTVINLEEFFAVIVKERPPEAQAFGLVGKDPACPAPSGKCGSDVLLGMPW